MGKLKIDLLGTSFSVSANEDSEYLNRLLDYYKQITQTFENSGKIKDPLKISILSGIALVDELYAEKQKNAKLLANIQSPTDKKVENITNDMLNLIDKVLYEKN